MYKNVARIWQSTSRKQKMSAFAFFEVGKSIENAKLMYIGLVKYAKLMCIDNWDIYNAEVHR